MPQGTLFTEDFLNEGIRGTDAWRSLPSDTAATLRQMLSEIFAKVATPSRLNESQTEDRIIKPIFDVLGWQGCYWVQERLETKGRANVPDYLLFGSVDDFAKADRKKAAAGRYPLAIAVADAKAWNVNLDRRGAGAGAHETPSGQILRYLSRADVQSNGKVQWGVLTNGRHWRLYYQGAKSRLEEYFEIDLAWLLHLEGAQGDLGALVRPRGFNSDTEWGDHLLKIMWLMFRRDAFLPGDEGRTFHQLALTEGREWEARVRGNVADVVFQQVFPNLLRALKRADPDMPPILSVTYLATLREAALTLLYRLLFALYAEDRDLLPKRDPNYGGLSRLRDEIAERIDAGTTLSGRRKGYANVCAELFKTIDKGDDTLGVPPYNGGLFSDRTPATDLLERAALPDDDFAILLDCLARTDKDGRRVRINFRDLSVQQLGAIYERLLEYEPVPSTDKPDGIDVRLNPFARKGSGSYYTPDELVSLIIARTVGPLVDEKLDAFKELAKALSKDRRSKEIRLDELRQKDPAEEILKLKIVDPAMGSGHFLVSLVDFLADKIMLAIIEARETVTWAEYVSPLVRRLADVWAKIRAEADHHKWVVRDDQLADKNLVKRFILKRCVYGVDKNLMAVELAKVALWLHTFTAGAPLSFLDHHLHCGDSLYGEWVRKALDELAAGHTLMISSAVKAAEQSIAGMAMIENLSDADIAEVKTSANAFKGVEERTEPLRRFLDFWQALKWLELTDDEKAGLRAALDHAFGPPLAVLGGLQPPDRPTHLTDEALQLFHEGGAEQLQMREFGRAGTARDYVSLTNLLARAHTFANEQRFLHWEIAFPGVWKNWVSSEPDGGFDAVIGNPPWDQVDFEQVKWFEDRDPGIARAVTDAERKRLIRNHHVNDTALWQEYQRADALFDRQLARSKSAFPLFSARKFYIHFGFVEQSRRLLNATGTIGLLVPLGVVAHYSAARFVENVLAKKLLREVIDFENRMGPTGSFFPDIDARTKFCILVLGAPRDNDTVRASFFTRLELPLEEQFLELTSDDIQRISPNLGVLPIAQSVRALGILRKIYTKQPVFSLRNQHLQAWPLNYSQLFNRATDSNLFVDIRTLEDSRAIPIGNSRFRMDWSHYFPVYEGKMVKMYNHRGSSIVRNEQNLFRRGQPRDATAEELADPSWSPTPDFWMANDDLRERFAGEWLIGIKDVTSVTNERTVIAALIPRCAPAHTLPVLMLQPPFENGATIACYVLANLNSFCLDFIARQKVQTNHVSEYILHELAVVELTQLEKTFFGKRTAADIIKNHVLRLSYAANDMEPFARDMEYFAKDGSVNPPIIWDEAERRHLRARLDALYFALYGIVDEDDIRYILSTFSIVERKDRETFDGVYLTRELVLWYTRALKAGDSNSTAPQSELIRLAKARGD